jgi:segregation and condensation protein A
MMRELDLDIAGEYLLMAATLAHIKSRMLLPKAPQDQQDDADGQEIADPRLELMRRLLEYQKYKAAAEELGARPVVGRDVFGRGSDAVEAQGPPPLAAIPIFRLLDAFQAILDRAQGRTAFQITAQRISLQERIVQLTELLRERRTCVFESLFSADVTRFQVVITFLAVLEMTKVRILRVYQADHRSAIHVSYALLDADDDGQGGAVPAFVPTSDASGPSSSADSEPPGPGSTDGLAEDSAQAAPAGQNTDEDVHVEPSAAELAGEPRFPDWDGEFPPSSDETP